MRQKLTSRLGSSPATVRKYLERESADVLEERWKAQMTSCPQKQKFMIIQQATSANIRRRYLPFSSTPKEWQSYLLYYRLFQNSARISISSGGLIVSFPLVSSILLMTPIPASICPCSSRNLGDSSSAYTDPQRTMKLGKAPQTIINFQLVSAKTGLRKSQPSSTAYSLPMEIQKLMRSMPFPRQAVGLTSANILVVTTTVNPNEKPQRKRRNTIVSSESARQKIPLTDICKMAPYVMRRFRPQRSARKPLLSEPSRMPKQKMLASSSRVAGVAWGKRARMMGLRKELRTSSTPSFMSTRHSSRKVRK